MVGDKIVASDVYQLTPAVASLSQVSGTPIIENGLRILFSNKLTLSNFREMHNGKVGCVISRVYFINEFFLDNIFTARAPNPKRNHAASSAGQLKVGTHEGTSPCD